MVLNERYELHERIGAGGEARVFRARDLVMNTEVAVRLSPSGASLDAVLDFPGQHPGWVRLFRRDADPIHGVYAVFELLRGETLGAMVARGPLLPAAWIDFVRQSLDAVDVLHQAGWVHGDLNADNFFFDAGKTWKLLDLPFHQPAEAVRRSPLFGSIYTLAPEQFGGRAAGTPSDIYALGCLYYAAATGRYPHAEGTEAEIAVARLRFPTEPLRELAPGFPPPLADWVMCLLERDPSDRPASLDAARMSLNAESETL